MSKLNKFSFIKDEETRKGVLSICKKLKTFAKTYYTKYVTCYKEVMKPYRDICKGICGGDGSINMLVSPELGKLFEEEIRSRCSEEEKKFEDAIVTWDMAITYLVLCSAITWDEGEQMRNEVWDELSQMKSEATEKLN